MPHHAEPIAILQPSLHSVSEFTRCVLKIAIDLGVSEARQLFDEYQEEFDSEIFDEVCDALSDNGFPNVCQDDTFLIWPKGSELPEEWAQ
jgi:hypothetical protein